MGDRNGDVQLNDADEEDSDRSGEGGNNGIDQLRNQIEVPLAEQYG